MDCHGADFLVIRESREGAHTDGAARLAVARILRLDALTLIATKADVCQDVPRHDRT